jgi:hypothetical protein
MSNWTRYVLSAGILFAVIAQGYFICKSGQDLPLRTTAPEERGTPPNASRSAVDAADAADAAEGLEDFDPIACKLAQEVIDHADAGVIPLSCIAPAEDDL